MNSDQRAFVVDANVGVSKVDAILRQGHHVERTVPIGDAVLVITQQWFAPCGKTADKPAATSFFDHATAEAAIHAGNRSADPAAGTAANERTAEPAEKINATGELRHRFHFDGGFIDIRIIPRPTDYFVSFTPEFKAPE